MPSWLPRAALSSWLPRAALLVAGLAPACSPSAAPAPAAPPASVGAPPAFDPGRPDAALLAALAALPPLGPALEGLRRASRDEVSAAVAALDPAERRRVERGEGGADRRRPLVALALGRSSPEVLYELACRGGASRELLAPRGATEGARAPALDEVALSSREAARRAAAAFARSAYEQARRGPPLDAATADRLGEAALVLGSVPLRRAALEHAVKRAPTPARLLAASFAASHDLDAPAAERLLEAVDRADARTLERLDEARADAALAAAFRAKGGAGAVGPDALEAALVASRLGRHDLVSALLARAGVDPAAHLQAAVAEAMARVAGSLCGGLEWSHEYAGLCPAAFRADPGARGASERLRAAFASGRGRDAWSVERYAGLVAVVPMMYGLTDPAGEGPAARARLADFRGLLGEALAAPEGLAPARREALGLVNELLGEMMGRPQNGPLALEPRARAALVGRARAALAAQGASPEVRRAALAVAMAVALDDDPSPLLAGVPDAADTLGARGALGAWAGVARRRAALVRSSLADLDRAALGAGAPAFRAALYAGEVRVAVDPSRPVLAAFEARLVAAKPPPDAGPADRLRWAIDAVGVAARLGARAAAEARYREASEELASYPPDDAWRPTLALFDALGAALLATAPERETRRRAAARLRPLLGREADGAEVRAYRAAWLAKVLRDDELPACGDAACRARAEADLRRARDELRALSEGPRGVGPALARRGAVPGDASRLSLHFGFREGIVLVTEFDPRLCVVPPPPPLAKAPAALRSR